MQKIPLFTLFGLKATISPLGIASFLAVIPLMGWIAARLLPLMLVEALMAGAIAGLITFVFEWVHQWGHALAARRVGYPMIGMHWHSWLSASVYPEDEPPLPPRVHIKRALGGFWINVLIGLLLAPLAFYFWRRGGVLAWAIAFASAWNFLVLGLGALLPIDIPGVFTIDGGTILRYWREIKRTRMNADKR